MARKKRLNADAIIGNQGSCALGQDETKNHRGEFTRRLPISDCRQKTAEKRTDTVSRIRRCLFWIILADIRN